MHPEHKACANPRYLRPTLTQPITFFRTVSGSCVPDLQITAMTVRSFASEEGKDKWTSYKFTKNVYDLWMPTHLRRICLVIDNLPPDIDFDIGESGLSQGLESYQLSGYVSQDAASLLEDAKG